MKTIIKYILLFSLMFSLKGIAQELTSDARISNKTTMKGKRELRKEKRRHHNAVVLAAGNERKSRKSKGIGTVNRHDAKSKKMVKDRRKNRSKDKKDKNREEKDRESKDITVPDEEKAKG